MTQTTALPALAPPLPGQLVSVRQRRCVVTKVDESTLGGSARAQHLVHLQSIDDDGLGEELRVVWELELGVHVFEKTSLPDPRLGFDEPARLDAFLDAVRWGAVASADVRAIHAPFRSGVTIEDYQLDPLVRAVEMPRVSLLIADDVGLGKTIEAGLVLQELLLRFRARTALIVCPAGLQLQWRDQMRDKFGLEFRIVDSELLRELRRTRGLGVNPWTCFPRLITSMDFLKRSRPMRLFREALPGPGEPTYPRRFDLLILDEAHNAAPAGKNQFALDSLRTEAIREIAPHFEHKLFLTATPHNGYTESFAALLELLDDQRFHRGVTPDRAQLERVMVRRLKKELPRDNLGRARFPTRTLAALEVDFAEAEREAHRQLRRYAELRADDGEGGTFAFATQFVMKLLKKRLFSSPEAFHITLKTHLASVRRGGPAETASARPLRGALRREIARFDEELDRDDVHDQDADTLLRETSRVLRPLSAEEATLVDALLAWSERAAAQLDAKARTLLAWLEANVRPAGKWNDTRVIVFTEYRATQKWLASWLATRGFAKDGRLLALYGGMDSKEREAVKHAFQAAPDVSNVRILLATDAASEGIDLQNHCSRLVHYDIPWNPNRMEQRNGRVDRHGQKADKVELFHFVGSGWHEARATKDDAPGSLEGDLEFLFRAMLKVDQIREDLGNVGDVIATQLEEAMLGKRQRLDGAKPTPRASAARKMLAFERSLESRLHALVKRLGESRDELHLEPSALRAVVEVALAMANHPPLQVVSLSPNADGDAEVEAFMIPALAGSWAACLEGLAHPHTGVKRPITFDHDIARDRDDVVLAHLGHRLVQMCIALLRAEVWAPPHRRKLARVSVRSVKKLDHPVLAAHARLVILGGDSSRLHEEIIVAGGELDRGAFSPLTAAALRRALQAGEGASASRVHADVEDGLGRLWPGHEEGLRATLEQHAADREAALLVNLRDRCTKEIADQAAILAELERSLRAELGAPRQLELFDAREIDQSDRNRAAMLQRLESLPEERLRETATIRARYASPTARLFPVAVTYLVPSGMVSR